MLRSASFSTDKMYCPFDTDRDGNCHICARDPERCLKLASESTAISMSRIPGVRRGAIVWNSSPADGIAFYEHKLSFYDMLIDGIRYLRSYEDVEIWTGEIAYVICLMFPMTSFRGALPILLIDTMKDLPRLEMPIYRAPIARNEFFIRNKRLDTVVGTVNNWKLIK